MKKDKIHKKFQMKMTRRQIVKAGLFNGAAMMVLSIFALSVPSALAAPPSPACPPGQAPAYPGSGDCILDSTTIPQYVIPLVIPPVMNNDGADDSYDIAVRQFKQQILPGGIWDTVADPTDIYANFPATTVWSYGPTADILPDSTTLGGGVGIAPAPNSQFNYPAYTFETKAAAPYSDSARGPVSVYWRNELMENFGAGPRFLSHLLPIDQTLHWANPAQLCADGTRRTDCRGFIPERYMGPVPIVTHVHGSHVEGHSDGYPEAWWLPAARNIPGGYATHGTTFDDADGNNPGNEGYAHFVYRNDQPAMTGWYHDHALGMTRNNVYAGPAGFWLIRGGVNDLVDDTLTDTAWDGTLPYPAPAQGEGVLEVNLPPNDDGPNRGKYREIPIVIQDRSFKADGSLWYPANRASFEGVMHSDLTIPFIPSRRSDISPIWNPEAFFNTMVVNGVSWPVHEVAPAKYRFRFLNGCNSRFLILQLVWVAAGEDVNDPANWNQVNGAFWQIGAEQGFLPAPVQLSQLLMGLAERADVIMDFAWIRTRIDGAPGTYSLHLVNVGPDEPFGGFPVETPADPATTGQVMKFVVNEDLLGLSDSDQGGPGPDATAPSDLALNAEEPLPATPMENVRQVTLNEAVSEQICVNYNEDGDGNVTDIRQIGSVRPGPDFEADCEAAGGEPFGPKEALLGVLEDGNPVPLLWTDQSKGASVDVTIGQGDNATIIPVWVTENPTLNTQETWEIYNVTADAHPIHLHLVRFQVINRGGLFKSDWTDPESVVFPIRLDDRVPRRPEPWETGYKDTVIAYPGEVTRIKAVFDIAGLYVWHCHIVEHEDNEMMRPFVVSEAEDEEEED